MKIAALASGSAGNCFYIEDDKSESAVLIDAGISTRQIALRLAMLGLTVEKVKGIFITHEHADHIKGADVFARKYQVPIFATKKTIDSCLLCSDKSLIKAIKNGDVEKIAQNLHNDFEFWVPNFYPAILKIKRKMMKAGALGALMSGSGPTVFCVCENHSSAVKIAHLLKKEYPQTYLAQTI